MKLNSKYHLVIDLVQILSGSIAVVVGVIAFRSFCYDSDNRPLFVITILAIIILMLFLLVVKYWGMAISRYENYNEKFHKLNHRLRDEIYKLKQLDLNEEITNKILAENLQNTGQFVVDTLAELLTEITGNVVSVHIKTFPVTSTTQGAFRTLCISKKSEAKRLTLHDHPIKGNTHLRMIVESKDETHFLSNDLKKTIKDYKEDTHKDFLISTQNWDNWYSSIIVVPIRIESKLKNTAGHADFEYLGFICCDAKEKRAFRESEINGHLHLIKAFADSLYIYLDEIKNYSAKCKDIELG